MLPQAAPSLPGVAVPGGDRPRPHDVVDAVLARLAERRGDSAWISLVEPAALRARADELEALPADLPLYGVPFAVKDNIDVDGLPTTAACPAFAYAPGKDAGCVARLLAAGAIVVGKTNLDQFATGLGGTRSPLRRAGERVRRRPDQRRVELRLARSPSPPAPSPSPWARTPRAPAGCPRR